MALGGMDLGYGLENLINLARERRPQSSDLVRDLPATGPMPGPDVAAPGRPLPDVRITDPGPVGPSIPAEPVATAPGGPVPGAEPVPVATPEEPMPDLPVARPPIGPPRMGRIVGDMMRERQPEARVVEGER